MKMPQEHLQPDLRQIFYFVKLAEHGSLSATAEALGMAQPSLSASLSKLEKSVGVKLTRRGARGTDLTPAGHLILARAQRLLKQSRAMVDLAQTLAQADLPEVRLALTPSLGSILAVPLAESFPLEAPDIKLHITEGMSFALHEQLLNNQLDLAASFEPHDPQIFHAWPLLTEELFLVTAPDNWPDEITPDGYAKTPISLETLAKLPLALPQNSYGGRRLVEQALAARGLWPNIAINIDGLQQLLQIAMRASAYTILPKSPLLDYISMGKLALVAIEGAPLKRRANLLDKRGPARPEARLAVLRAIYLIMAELKERYQLPLELHSFDPDSAGAE